MYENTEYQIEINNLRDELERVKSVSEFRLKLIKELKRVAELCDPYEFTRCGKVEIKQCQFCGALVMERHKNTCDYFIALRMPHD